MKLSRKRQRQKSWHVQINITDLWEKYEKISSVKVYVGKFKEFRDKKQIFATYSEN